LELPTEVPLYFTLKVCNLWSLIFVIESGRKLTTGGKFEVNVMKWGRGSCVCRVWEDTFSNNWSESIWENSAVFLVDLFLYSYKAWFIKQWSKTKQLQKLKRGSCVCFLYLKFLWYVNGIQFELLIDWLIDWCLTPTLAIFQLYRGVNC
jgi:hypothetical protein